MEINEDRIKQVVAELHQRKPGEILSSMEIYKAITHEQYEEDHKETTMELEKKVKILKGMDTKNLIERLIKYEDELQKVMTAQADFKNQYLPFLASTGDCSEVKRILAELAIQAPETDENTGKKLTVPDKENWLLRQREENKELNEAIAKQRQVAFLLDDHQIKVEMSKKRLEGLRGVLALKTAQINFLAAG